jgi:uncharacterized protein YndB with AHSA1/START domain
MVGERAPEQTTAKVFEHAVELEASIEAVWKAVSTGDELRRWFPIDARVKPPGRDGKGGTVFLSWGPACEGEAPITIWDPPRRLGWNEKHDEGAVLIAADFHLEGRGGSTVLRLVQSGFGKGAKWDDYYDSISNGWKYELRSLRHYLARHRGEDRRCCFLPTPAAMPTAAAWERLVAPGALVKEGSLGGWAEGQAYRFVGPDGRKYSGVCERSVPEKMFAGTVSELDDALMRIEIERSGAGASQPFFWLSIWGKKSGMVDEIGAAWQGAMGRALA